MGSDKKIKICHIISGDLWAGAEMAMYTLVRGLKARPEFEITALVMNDGKLAAKLGKIGIKTLILNEEKYSFISILIKSRQFVRENHFDIIHTHRFKENILGALIKGPGNVKALAKTIHGITEPFNGIKRLKTVFYNFVDIYFSKFYFNAIITVSEEIKTRIVPKMENLRVVAIHNSIETNDIKNTQPPEIIKKSLGIDPSIKIIGTAGRMVPVKGLEIFINAAQIIAEKRNDVVFLLAGDGPEKKKLEEYAKRLGLEDRVIFTGFRDDIVDIINCFDILLLSSFHEGIPMVLLEGMALGKVLIATAVGGVTEVIDDGVSGLLVKSGDRNSLAEACIKVIDTPELAAKLVQGAYKKLKEEYSIETQIERISKLYLELGVGK